MANEDETVWIVFNGEIYNHVELRRELEPRHRFRSASDTEVILHLYEERGAEAVRRLRGFFAFALWDGRRRRLMLARDRLGKKPLHYRLGADGIDFASEIPGLLATGGPRELDAGALGTYLCLGYVPAPATAIRGIRRLPAGSVLIYEGGSAEMVRYWSPPLPDPEAPEEPAADDSIWRSFMPLLEQSARLRLRSDVPVGVFLSGGLDSSVVAALAARNSREPLKSFTVVFEESGYDESAPARETAAALGMDHQEIRVQARAAEALPALIRRIGEPLADSSLVAVHRLSEAVRREVKVALSGDGGDEIFLGYDRYRAHRLAERWRRLPVLARSAAETAVAVLPGPRGRRNLAGRASRFVAAASEDPLASNDRWICRFLPSDLPDLLTDDALAALPGDPLEPLHHLYAEASTVPPLDAIARADLALWLPEDVLRKVDAASMACGLEVRSPLLDQEIVEAASRLPASAKMRRARGKEILRACAGAILPRRLLSRRKAGFGLPVDRWLRSGALRDLARDLLLSSAARHRGLIRPAAVRRLLDEHESGAANHDEAIWTLTVLEIFLEEVVEATP
jgi:asparagine synthase (glutamine-hydrolysing)